MKFPALYKGHSRTVKAKKNISASFLIKGLNILINFAFVPLTLSYIDETRYGIWFTVSSVIGWFYFLDVGLGNGLRNKLAEALARGETELARRYISTAYAALLGIIAVIYVLFVMLFGYLDWTVIFNAPRELNHEIGRLIFVVFSFFCLRFVLNLITVILTAMQNPAFKDAFNLAGSLLAFIIVFILTKTTQGSLVLLGAALTFSPVFVLTLGTLILFFSKYKIYRPAPRLVRLAYVRDLLNIGVQFFVIQISAIVVFTTDNMIITQILGPEAVTPYNIAFKYMSAVTLLFGIMVTPFWSAVTDAYVKKDFMWIKNIVKKFKRIWIGVVGLVILMVFASPSIYHLWIGDKIKIPFELTALMGLFVVITTWSTIFVQFINGVGKIRLQLYHAIFIGVINIPLSIWLAGYFNSSGVILATLFCQVIGAVWVPIQYRKIVNGTARGIWDQ